MVFTGDVSFVAYLRSRGIVWSGYGRDTRGRTEFYYDLPEEVMNQHRTTFASGTESVYAQALEFVTRLVQDQRRNRKE